MNSKLKIMQKLLMQRLLRLGSDDRGAIFWFGAIILFISLSIFSMTYDTSKFIEKKMVAQNAADAAALEMVVWQARALNVVQEINTDIYEIDTIVATSINAMSVALALLDLTIAGTVVSFNWGTTASLVNFRNGAFSTICKVVLTTFKALRYVTVNALKGIRYALVYGTNAVAYLGAIEAAKINGASPIYGKFVADKLKFANGLPSKLAAIGIPLSKTNPLLLPVKKKNDKSGSLNTNKGWTKTAAGHLKLFLPKVRSCFKGKWFPWNDEFFESERKTPYPAWLWVAQAEPEGWLMSDMFLWRKSKISRPPTTFAYAIGQPRGGNIVCYASNSGSRKLGNGAGIEGSLIPVSELKNWNKKFTAFLENLMFMH